MDKYKQTLANKVFEAGQWFKDGDHPDVTLYKGEDGEKLCGVCVTKLKTHGRMKKSGAIICPGEWVIKDEKGQYLVPHDDEKFKSNFELIKEPLKLWFTRVGGYSENQSQQVSVWSREPVKRHFENNCFNWIGGSLLTTVFYESFKRDFKIDIEPGECISKELV